MNYKGNSAHDITPYLTVKNATAAIEFYKKVFGATEVGRITMGDKIGHAELKIGDSSFMLADEFPEWGNKSPETLGGTPGGINLYVPDADAVYKKAVDAGSTVKDAIKDQFYGDRSGTVIDPFGHKWMIATSKEVLSFPEMQKRMDAMMSEKK